MSKLETNTIDTISGTNTLQVGDGNVATINLGKSGDTINIPSGATITNSGTANNFGGNNVPFIQANLAAVKQDINDSTGTVVAFNAVSQQSGGTWDSSNYRWTPGVAGKYYVTVSLNIDADDNTDLINGHALINKNGSIEFYISQFSFVNNYIRSMCASGSAIITLDDNDYIDISAFINTNSGTARKINGETKQSWFNAYKIIE